MKKIIRSTNDLLLAVLMGGLSIFLLLSKKIITGVENGLGGMWAQASACNRIQPNLETLQRIAEILQVDLKDLITDKKERLQ